MKVIFQTYMFYYFIYSDLVHIPWTTKRVDRGLALDRLPEAVRVYPTCVLTWRMLDVLPSHATVSSGPVVSMTFVVSLSGTAGSTNVLSRA